MTNQQPSFTVTGAKVALVGGCLSILITLSGFLIHYNNLGHEVSNLKKDVVYLDSKNKETENLLKDVSGEFKTTTKEIVQELRNTSEALARIETQFQFLAKTPKNYKDINE